MTEHYVSDGIFTENERQEAIVKQLRFLLEQADREGRLVKRHDVAALADLFDEPVQEKTP
jgi:hypothetical protein